MTILSLLICAFLAQHAYSERFLLYRATPQSEHALQILNKIQLQDHKYKVDFWKNSMRVGGAADVMVSEKYSQILEQRFAESNIDFTIALEDVERLIQRNEGNASTSSFSDRWLHDDPILDSEPDRDHSKIGKLRRARYPFGDYASYSDMMKYMRTIEFYYPKFTKVIRIGTTHEGKPIEGLKIGFPINNVTRRGVWIDSNIHAREWASSHTSLYIINQLVSGYGKDETITHYVNNLNFYIVPCLNPDGYEFTRSSPTPSVRLWRKNRSPEKCRRSSWGGEKCCQGVDLNRNFKFHWSESGSSFEPCSNIYHGEMVFSEPEAKAVRDFHATPELKGNIDAFITLHSYAQLWIFPFSHAVNMYPNDVRDLRKTARKAIIRLRKSYGTEYRTGTGADTLGPASGGSDDWAKAELKVKYVYLVELRPQKDLSNGFILHKNELIPTAIETFEGIQEVIEAVLEQNNIKKDPLTKISEQLRRKQLYRLKLEQEIKNKTTTKIPSATISNLPTKTTAPLTTTTKTIRSTTTQRPSTTTTRRPNPTTTRQQTTVTQQKSTVTQQQTTVTQQESTVTQKATTTAQQETTVTQQKSTVTQKQTTVTPQDSTVTRPESTATIPTTSPSTDSTTSTTTTTTSIALGRRTWLRSRNEENVRELRRKISKSPTTTVALTTVTAEITTTSATTDSGEDNSIESGSASVATLLSSETTTIAAPRNTTRFVFFTNTKPASFKDPNCRDMRFSCAFWVRQNENACAEQESFMRAQCAFTCKFCTTDTEQKRSRQR